ncbi:MAG TPA: hypothetical protein VG734_08165 [Lacunisphaera sp.]|nr:hypothetical protein [Lacunisphaera sp.]
MPHHSKVSVEDLLRLKRAERPGPEFWTNFEGELRQRQLTALVQKRRWWHELSTLMQRRIYLPAGAAAILAFTLVAVRYSVPNRIAQDSIPAAVTARVDSAVEELAPTEIPVSIAAQVLGSSEATGVAPHATHVTPAASDSFADAAITATIPADVSPSQRSMNTSLTRLSQSEPAFLEPLLDERLNAPVRAQPASIAQAEVASMTASTSSKYRLIARYVDRSLSPAPTPPAVVRERLARRLGDDINDDISRIGVVGSRVSLKF